MGKSTINNDNDAATVNVMSHRKPHTKLLRRRHSLPEIIMRKHQLATQKNSLSNLIASTAPSPPARERVPPSFELSAREHRIRTSSPQSSSISLTSSSSTIVANDYQHTTTTTTNTQTTGSDSNLNRIYPSNGSMRQQLLRRLWHKEYRRFDRTGSLSPPLHRSLRTKRTFRLLENSNSPEVCLECQKLETEHFNRSVPEITMKRIKHNNLSSSSKMQSSSGGLPTVALPRKSYSIETESLNGNTIMSNSNGQPPTTTATTITKTKSATSSEVSNDNFTQTTTEVNSSVINEKTHTTSDNSILIEMNDDRINITEIASADSTAATDSTLQVSSSDDSHEQSIIVRPSNDWYQQNASNDEYIDRSNNNNNNNNNDSKDDQSKSNRLDNLNNNNDVTTNVDDSSNSSEKNVSTSTTYDAYYMDNGNNTENESSVRLITNETIDQTTLDTIISQILVDSLNNIIVVQGKVNETNATETQVTKPQQDYPISSNISSASASSLPLPVTDQIYFPHYLSTETLSEYSTKLSNNSSAIELLPSNLVISVISGSSYPPDGGEMVVHRLTDMPRTESMEVQPSSARSRRGTEDPNGNFEQSTIIQECSNQEDDTISLVDSLDNPEENLNDTIEMNVSVITPKSAGGTVIEKSQAFFIPIENAEKTGDGEIVSAPSIEHPPSGLEADIANSLPNHLRERLEKRQMEINARKEAEQKQRQEKIQKLIHQHDNTNGKGDIMPSFEVIPDKSPTKSNVKKLPGQTKALTLKKDNNKQLRTEIGLLESYTVDAKGNLQFVESGAKSNGIKKITTVTGPIVKKHVAIKKTITTKPIAPVKRIRENNAVIAKKTLEKRSSKVQNASVPNRVKENEKKCQDVQKMTLVHHSPSSDMITPDNNDCGPRRMYQKTEICEGTKRIEILEIVECGLNSSPDSLNPNSSADSASCSLVERFSAKHSSKIPVPVPIKSRTRTRTILNATQQRTLRAQIRDSMHSGSSMNNSKVDQIIADLLIEALNHSTDIGIEFIKTPQNLPTQSIISLNNNNNNNNHDNKTSSSKKRMNLSTRRTGNAITSNVNASNTSGKRSAHSSAKYQQVFDSIPEAEEKSSSLSIDSPNEEIGPTSSVSMMDKNSSIKSISENSSINVDTVTQMVDNSETKSSSNYNAVKVANGKAAIESDSNKVADTWFGFFGRTHVDSPIDSMLLDEGILKVVHTSSVAFF